MGNCNGSTEWQSLIYQSTPNFFNIPVIYEKFFFSLKHIDLTLFPYISNQAKRERFHQNFEKFTNSILRNVSELHTICIKFANHKNTQHLSFSENILKNSHLTLRRIEISPLTFSERVTFPNLSQILFCNFYNYGINEFKNSLQYFLNNAPNLKIIHFSGVEDKRISQQILDNSKNIKPSIEFI